MANKLNMFLNAIRNNTKKHTPEIFITIGVIGFAFAAFAACLETPKAMEVKEKCEKEGKSKLRTAGEVALQYLPAISLFTFSVVSVAEGNAIQVKRLGKVIKVCNMTKTMNDTCVEAIKDTVSAEAAETILNKAAEKRTEKSDNEVVITSGEGGDLYLDSFTGRLFRAKKNEIDEAVIRIREELQNLASKGENRVAIVDYNMFWRLLELEESDVGDIVAFAYYPDDELISVSYRGTMKDGEPCGVIEWSNQPSADWIFYDPDSYITSH